MQAPAAEAPAAEEAAAEEAAAEEAAPARVVVVDTAPLDARFPTTNQARHCFVKYSEAHKCLAEGGDCARLVRDYRSICPQEWLERWNTAREEGSYHGKY